MRAPMLLNFLAELAPSLLAKKDTLTAKTSEENLIEGSSRSKTTKTKQSTGFLTQ